MRIFRPFPLCSHVIFFTFFVDSVLFVLTAEVDRRLPPIFFFPFIPFGSFLPTWSVSSLGHFFFIPPGLRVSFPKGFFGFLFYSIGLDPPNLEVFFSPLFSGPPTCRIKERVAASPLSLGDVDDSFFLRFPHFQLPPLQTISESLFFSLFFLPTYPSMRIPEKIRKFRALPKVVRADHCPPPLSSRSGSHVPDFSFHAPYKTVQNRPFVTIVPSVLVLDIIVSRLFFFLFSHQLRVIKRTTVFFSLYLLRFLSSLRL